MSGIVGVLRFDGAPVDPHLMGRMTDSLAYRGPDGQEFWIDNGAALGHTLLRTAIDSARKDQPLTLDGTAWITADARLDRRADLIAELGSLGRHEVRSADDAQLILHAYHAWGAACVEHLLGDFAFAIWDTRTRRLFCARDHFGVKPFYYAQIEGALVFSNTLECVRQHPSVEGAALNEVAIADFLVFGFNQDPTTTTFAGVRRLSPAHTLTCENGTVRLSRYWSLPADGRVRYRRARDYVEHFMQIFREAISDRLRTDRAAVWMSGGLDSTSIAAIARRLLSEQGRAEVELRAHTIVYDSLIADDEREYAEAAARWLGIPVSYFVADGCLPFDGWNSLRALPPEPTDDPFHVTRNDQLTQVAWKGRVLLCGEGGDEVLATSHIVDLAGRMPLLELSRDVVRSVVTHRRRPGAGIRAKLKRFAGRGSEAATWPAWLNPAFAERVNLRARVEQASTEQPTGSRPLRAQAHQRLATPAWSWYFECADPGVTRVPIECRYPFMDVRLVEYLLAIPPLPWFVDKLLLREAMRGTLPDRLRLRPKTALGGDPLAAHLRRGGVTRHVDFQPAPGLLNWVVTAAVPPLTEGAPSSDPWQDLRPICLNYWLRNIQRQEATDDRAFAAVERR